jgi:pentapeptide MXKDX repeat protein
MNAANACEPESKQPRNAGDPLRRCAYGAAQHPDFLGGNTMRTHKPAALAIVAALALAACGGDSEDPVASAPVEDDEMADDEMSDDEMADDEMADDEMGDDEMGDDEMADDEMADDEMGDDEMADDEMADDEMADDEMADDEMADDEMADDEMADMNDVMSVIIGRDDLTVLDDAIHAAGLNDTLHNDGPFTVFAPTNEAFAVYLGEMGMSAEDALADTETLTTLLQAHVVAGTDDSAMVMDMAGQSFTTLAGNELAIVVDGDVVMVGGATVTVYDLSASNGVIHIIDTVLTPPAG